jgi:autotransporter-associated beta strand protein
MNLRSWTRLLTRLVKEQSRQESARLRKRRDGLKRLPHLEWLEERVAPAATDMWLGGAGGNKWSIAANWSLGRSPVAGDDIVFGNQANVGNRTTTNDIGGIPIYNSITISSTGYSLLSSAKGPEIGLSGTFTVNQNIGLATMSIALEIAPPIGNLQQVAINVGSASTLDISGQLFDLGGNTGASETWTKTGGGILQLDGNNTTYTGAITIANTGGTLSITNANALGTGAIVSGVPSAGITTVNPNSQLQVQNIGVNSPIPERLKVNGTGIINDGAILNGAGNNVWAGTVELDLDTYFGANVGTSLNFTGQISDNGAGHNLTKVGAGTVIFSHVGGDTYRGTTTINNGILNIQDPNALGNSTTHFSTTTVNYNKITDIGGTLQLDNETPGRLNGNFPGFVVNNEALILNGPGYGGVAAGIGALDNLDGNNTWTNNVTLGSAQPNKFPVNIGSETQNGVATNVMLSGLVQDPIGAGPSDLNKIGPGRLIITADVSTFSDATGKAEGNTFTGRTTVVGGYLNIEDSQALGAQSKLSPITVDNGASLELELKLSDLAGTSGTGMVSAIGMTGRLDSILGQNPISGVSDQMTFGTGIPVGTPPIKPYDLTLFGLGINATGALHSISGINLWTGDVDLGIVVPGGLNFTGIGVDPDPNAHNSNLYFTRDYSLTISGIVSDQRLEKVDNGQLIMTNKNTYGPITGQPLDVTTLIQAGWITIRETTALGFFDPNITQTLEPYTQVNVGGALHILPQNNNLLVIPNNFILSGTGINHPFALINQAGALEDLDGYVNITGLIMLNNVAGIGVENVGLLATPTPQMTLQNMIADYNGTHGGITKLGSQRLIIEAPGSYTGPDDVKTGVLLSQYNTALGAGITGQTTTVEPGAALELGSSTPTENGGVQAGLEVWGEQLVLKGSGDPAFGDSALTVVASNNGLIGMVPGSDPVVTTDNIWRGPINLSTTTTITVQTNSSVSTSAPTPASGRLILAGNISGPASADLHVVGGGELDLAGNNTYLGTTYIDQGVVTVENNTALGGSPTAEVQTINLVGASVNKTQFTLTFNGVTTPAPLTYTGTAGDVTAVQNALDALTTIGGAQNVSGFVTVTSAGAGSFRVVFGGTLAGFAQPLMSGTVTAGSGSVSVARNTLGAGGTIVASGATLQLAGAVSIAGKPLIIKGTGDSGLPNTPVPTQWFSVGPAPTNPGETAGNNVVSGRVTGVVTDPFDPNVIYISTAGGGAWKTIDGGQTWRPLFDAIADVQDVVIKNLTVASKFTLTYAGQTTAPLANNATAVQVQNALDALPNIGAVGAYTSVTRTASTNGFTYTITFAGALSGNAVTQLTGAVIGAGTIATLTIQSSVNPSFALHAGAIAMDPNDFNTIYLGTGETDNAVDSFYGTGLYKSTDAGQTWSLVSGTVTDTVTVKGYDSPNPGTFQVTLNGGTTGNLDIQSSAATVAAALNALPNVANLNASVNVTATPVPEQQELSLIAFSGDFELTFNGATTGPIKYQGNGPTDAFDIQLALNALSTIGGVGGFVNVFYNPHSKNLPNTELFEVTFQGALAFYTQSLIQGFPVLGPSGTSSTGTVKVTEYYEGGVNYNITYNGILAQSDPVVTATATGGGNPAPPPADPASAVVTQTHPYNPFNDKGISKIIVSGPTGNEQIYVADGDSGQSGNGQSEVQQLAFGQPFPDNGPFTISFTGADQTGNVVTDTTGTLTYFLPNQTWTDVNTGIVYVGYNATADEIQNALDALSNIGGAAYKPVNGVGGTGGVGGLVNVAYEFSFFGVDFYSVAFGGSLSDRALPVMTANPPPPPANPFIIPSELTRGSPIRVINGSVGGSVPVGVWQLNTGIWSDLTAVTSPVRNYLGQFGDGSSLFPTTNTHDFTFGNPSGTQYIPGFPNNPGPDDDYRLSFPQSNATWSDIALANNGSQTFLFAALGSAVGTSADGSPKYQNAVFWSNNFNTQNPNWFVGDPFYNNLISDNERGNPSTGLTEFPNQGVIDPTTGAPYAPNGNIKISAVFGGDPAQEALSPPWGFLTIYASVANPDGSLRADYVSYDDGQTWQYSATTPPNYLSQNGDYANAVLAISSNILNVRPQTVYVGGSVSNYAAGTGQIYETTDAANTWNDISVDSTGNGPHTAQHQFFLDPNGNVDMVNDGGIWRLNTTNNTYTDLNGNLTLNAGLDIGMMNGVDGNPTDFTSAVGTSQSNGTDLFTNNPVGKLIDAFYTSPPPNASVAIAGGQNIYVDPNNPNIIYEVMVGLNPQRTSVRRSTDGGNTWVTLLDPYSVPSIQSPNVPLQMDEVNPDRILVGGGVNAGLYESLDQGNTWVDLSQLLPIVVGGLPDVLKGGHYIALAQYQGSYVFDNSFPLVGDQGTDAYVPDTIYVTDGTSIYLTKDHAQTWVNRSIPGAQFIVDIEVDPRNRDTVYAVENQFGANRVYRSTDAGQHWTEIGIKYKLPNVPAWKLVVDPRNDNLYLGTDDGVYVLNGGVAKALSSGVTWQRFGTGLPDVQVKDMVLNQTTNTLLAGSHGRSMYQIFLSAPETATNPVTGALVGLAGSSAWLGPVILEGDPVTNTVVIGADGNLNLPNNLSAASVNIIGSISDLQNVVIPTVDKIGLGDVIFSGSNVYGGATDIQQGALVAANKDALGQVTAGTFVETGATLELRSDLGPEPVTLNGNGFSFDGHYQGALRNISGFNTFTGNITLNPAASPDSVSLGADSGSQVTLTGSISGGGTGFTLVKEGTGTVALAGSDSFTGLTAVYTGALQLQNSSAIDPTNGAEVLDGGQLQLGDPTGTITTPVSINALLELSGTGINGTGALVSAAGHNTWAGNVLILPLPNFAPYSTPTGDVALSANAGATLEIGGQISQPSAGEQLGLTAVAGPSGAGTVILDKTSNYGGQTTVVAGNLDIENAGSLGTRTGSVVSLNGANVSSAAAIQQITTLNARGLGGNFTITLGGFNQQLGWGASAAQVTTAVNTLLNKNGYGTAGTSFNVTVTQNTIQTTGQNGPVGAAPVTGSLYTITIAFTPASGFVGTDIVFHAVGGTDVNGTTLASASTVAAGGIDTLVDNGAELQLQSTSGINVGSHILMLSGTGTANDGALHNVGGNNTWSGPIIMQGNTSFGADAGSSLTVSGTLIPQLPGITPDNLDKVDAGTLILTGINTYSPPTTTVDAGNLQVDRTITSNIVLNGGQLSGTGTVNGTVTSTSNSGSTGTIDASDNFAGASYGTLNVNGSVTLNNTDEVFVNLTDKVNPTSNLLNVTNGSINLKGASLQGLVDPSVLIGDEFTILKTDYATNPADKITGQFAGIPTTPLETGAASATIDFIDNGLKVVVDYFPDHVTLIRQKIIDSMTLTPSAGSPVFYGQPETFTANLTSEQGAPLPTGSVVFMVTDPTGTTTSYTLPIDASGNAVWDPTAPFPKGTGNPLQLGTYSISVSYNGNDASGNPFFTPASAGPVNITVTPAPTNTTLTSTWSTSPTSAVYGQDITFSATVLSAQSPEVNGTLPPAGTVSFYDTTGGGMVFLYTASLNTSTDVATFHSASLSTPLTAGTHLIEAIYNADGVPANYATSNQTISQVVAQDSTTITSLKSSLNPSVYGNTVTFTVTLVANAPGAGNPTGTVTFSDGGVTLGTGTLSTTGGVTTASFTTTALQLNAGANQTITATYNGDSNFSGTSSTLSQTVNKAATATTVTSSSATSVYGQLVTFTATVVSNGPGGGIPTGTVTFKDGLTILGLGTLSTSGGVTTATYTTTAFQLPVGTNQSITALYNGDNNFLFSSGTVSQTVNQDLTTTFLNSSANPSVFGEKVTFTATVSANSPGSGGPTGTVTFMDGSTVLGTATLSTSGGVTTASYTTTAFQLSVGANQTISASYPGDSNYLNSSTTLSQTVNQASTLTTESSSVNPSVFGQPVTFTATIKVPGPGSGNPTGTVTFTDGNVTLGTGTVSTSGGVTTASYTTTPFQLPTLAGQTIKATYNGDTNFTGSAFSITQTVNQDTTTTTVSSSTNPSVFGQAVTFTATVSANAPGSGNPTGTVTFTDGKVTLGTGTLTTSGGITTASFTTTATQLPTGVFQTITATYSGDTNYAFSFANVSQTVNQDTTTTTVTSSGSPSVFGQQVTFTATITVVSPGAGTPTGTVTFKDGGATIGTATVNTNGGVTTASYTTGAFQLPVGTNQTITAIYSGDANDLSSNGATVQNVNQDSTTTVLTSSLSTSVYGQKVTFTATVSANSPGSGNPTGTVTFSDGGVTLGTGTLSTKAGVTTATYTTSALQLQVGANQNITASYSGDTNYTTSSASIQQTVNPDSTTTTVASQLTPSVFGQAVTFTATVSANSPGSGLATGTVTFMDGNTTLGTGTLSVSGSVTVASYTTTAFQLPAGTSQTIAANYSGDFNFTSSSGTTTQTVNPDKTTTTITSSSLTSTYGQIVTFTATVSANSPGSGNPTGTVTFKDGSTVLGTGTLSSVGAVSIATYTTTAGQLPVGANETISANYASDGNYAASSGSLSETVNADGTTTTISSSANPSVFGQPVTFTATISANAPGSGNPTGTVTFTDGSVTLGTGTLSASGNVSIATYTTTANQLPVGIGQTITASYSGDNNFTPSSSSLTETVNQANTKTTLSSSNNPSISGQNVTFTAKVAATGASKVTPAGSVTFVFDGNSSSSVTVTLDASGQAQFSTNSLSMGSHTVVATYNPTNNFGTSVSSTLNQTVLVNTRANLTSSENPSTYGDTVIFTATVQPVISGFGTPTGTVTFTIDGGSATTVPLNPSAQATLSLSSLTIGGHTIAVTYNGDATFGSNSASLTQTVHSGTTTTLTTSAPSGSIFGQPVTFTASVVAVAPGTGNPTGTVSFFLDGSSVPAATVPLTVGSGNDQAQFSTNTLDVGGHTVTAVYNGDTNFSTSTSGNVTQSVAQVSTSTKLVASVNPATVGVPVTFTATVTSASPSTASPSGTVNFTIGGNVFSAPLTATGPGVAVATLQNTFEVRGNPTVVVSYPASTDFAGSSASVNETVLNASSTTLKSSLNPVAPGIGTGHVVTFTATVKSVVAGNGIPTGTVTFTIDGVSTTRSLNTLGVATLSVNTTTANELTLGNHAVTATYNGNGAFTGSSASLTQNVSYATRTTVTTTGNPTLYGNTPMFTARVSAVSAPAGLTPQGTVTFYIDGVAQTPVQLIGGLATFSPSALLSVGKHAIKAVYNGDDPGHGYRTSAGSLTQTISALFAKLKATFSAPFGIHPGEVFSITLKALNSLGGVATNFTGSGTVTVSSTPAGGSINGLNGTVTLTNGVVTITGLTTTQEGVYDVHFFVDGISTDLILDTLRQT